MMLNLVEEFATIFSSGCTGYIEVVHPHDHPQLFLESMEQNGCETIHEKCYIASFHPEILCAEYTTGKRSVFILLKHLGFFLALPMR